MDVNNIKNHTAETIDKVNEVTFILFEIIIYIAIDRILLDKILPSGIWSEIIRAIVFAVGYKAIYTLVKFLFNKAITKKYPRLDIDGQWFHVHIPNDLGENQKREKLSAGVTTISRELNDFTFSAENFRYTLQNGSVVKLSAEPSTTWCTETSEICDGNETHIVEVYRATSDSNQVTEVNSCPVCSRHFSTPKKIEESIKQRYGIHLYRIRNKEEIVCTYSDCWPSLKSGKLYMYRSEQKRDEKIKEFFEKEI